MIRRTKPRLKQRLYVTLGLLITLGIALAVVAYDLSSLQAGAQRPSDALIQRADQAGASFTDPDISSYSWFETQTDAIATVRVYAVESGHDASVLMIHGAGGGAWSWEPWMRAFSQEFNVYALSWRGHFDSSAVPDANRADYVRDTLSVLRAIQSRNEGRPIQLIAHSWGGPVAISITLQAPDAVQRMALLAPVVPLDSTPIRSLILPNVVRPIVRQTLQAGRPGSAFQGMFVSRALMQQYLDKYAGRPFSVEKPGLLADDQFLPERQAALRAEWQKLGQTGKPVLIVIARYDNVVSPIALRNWSTQVGAQIVEFDSGHYLQLDWLRYDVATAVASWLRQN